MRAENITRVLYPNENFGVGNELRLQQEYFLISASLQDIVGAFQASITAIGATFPDQVAIQLNDTHPALAIPELMRILLDEEGLEWEPAWDICVQHLRLYQPHHACPRRWRSGRWRMLERLLPRHLEIIYLINHHFLKDVARRFPGDIDACAACPSSPKTA